MKSIRRRSVTLGVIRCSLLAVLLWPALARADAPALVPVQGYLTDGDGAPLHGDTTLHLALYAAETGGTPLFEETQVVTVEQGYFTVYVGAIEALDLALFRDQGTLYVGLAVDEDPEMSPRLRLGTTPFAGFAQYCGFANSAGDASTLGGLAVSDFRLVTDAVGWSDITGVPGELSDGDSDTLASLTCSPNDILQWNGSAWVCSSLGGDITAVSAGLGLTGGGDAGAVTLSADTTYLQRRVGSSCAAGSAIRVIHADGTVDCEAAGSGGGGDITAVYPGTGITGGGDTGDVTLNADTTYLQRRVSGSCSTAQAMQSVAADGTPGCTTFVRSVGYSNGISGSLTNGDVSLWADTSYLQRRVSSACSTAEAMQSIAANGTPGCLGVITGISPSNGISGSVTDGDASLSLDTSYTDALYWSMGGNAGTSPGTDFLGTSDNQALELHVNGARALRIQPHSTSPILLGGYSGNSVGANVYGATIGGGGTSSSPNQVLDSLCTVSGGANNTAGDGVGTTADARGATVGGGVGNTASGVHATVAGGSANIANSDSAVVSGGSDNTAGNQYTVVAGGEGNSSTGYHSSVLGGYNNAMAGPYSVLGGGYTNVSSSSTSYQVIVGGRENQTSAMAGAVVGGWGNSAQGQYGFVGGGQSNQANYCAAVGGGDGNFATGNYSMIPGGRQNSATGQYAFAAGRYASADQDGCFVWGDSYTNTVSCGGSNRFVARAQGGVYFYTNGALTAGMYLAAGGSAWNAVSDRNLKENFVAVDPEDVLHKLDRIPISMWNYKSQDDAIRHLGPMAQDFHAAYGLGESDRHINTVNADGVALAAIQGLHRKVKALTVEKRKLKARLLLLERRMARLERGERVGTPRPERRSAGLGWSWLLFGGLGLGFLVLVHPRLRRRGNRG